MCLNNGWTIRNWIYTGILERLAWEYRVLVLTPVKDDPQFQEIISNKNIPVETSCLDTAKKHPFSKELRRFKDRLFYEILKLETQKIKRFEEQRSFFEKIASIIILILAKLPGSKLILSLLDRFDNALSRDRTLKNTLARFHPDILLSTHPYVDAERRLILEAHRQGIPIQSSILSWDNIFNKGMLPFCIDEIIVWNQIQKDRILSYYSRYTSQQIVVSGIPPFDIYRSSKAENFNKDNYLKTLKIKPEKQVLLYCTGPESLFPREPEIIQILIANMEKKTLPEDTHLLIRCHPHDTADRYARFFSHNRVTVVESSLDLKTRNTFTWIPPVDEMYGLMAMLKASRLCLNIASTTSLDAVACGLPVINIGFDGNKERTYMNSVRRYYHYSHYKDVVKTGGVKYVKDEKEMIYWIKRYLRDPFIDKDKRATLLFEQCWKLDGKSAERVVQIIKDFVSKKMFIENDNKSQQ